MADTPVGFLDEAWAEVVEAATWYEAKLSGLGDRLYAETDEALDRIAEAPEFGAPVVHRRVPRGARRVPLRSFRHWLIYVTRPRLVVVAFTHEARRPGYWARRMRGL